MKVNVDVAALSASAVLAGHTTCVSGRNLRIEAQGDFSLHGDEGHELQVAMVQRTSIRVFSNESVLRIRWPNYWSFSFSISPSNEHPGLISFRMEWLHLLAVQVGLESSLTPQFKSINCLSLIFLYGPILTSIMTNGKTIALTRWTFISNKEASTDDLASSMDRSSGVASV